VPLKITPFASYYLFQDLNAALDEALESFDLASTKWLEGHSRQKNEDAVKK
jgi:hypothetical protein